MSKLDRVKTLLLKLIGQSYVYDTVEEIAEVIGKNAFDTYEGRVKTHRQGAARLADSLAFQPGLVALHSELNDTWHYLMALQARARDLGCPELVKSLKQASGDIVDVMVAVDQAAEATVPQTPAASR